MTTVVCELCPHRCAIPEGAAGDCRIRVNLGGKLRATTYGRPSAVHVDPMEKKPLFHFLPGTPIFSVATAGCNLHCKNCQNFDLSQRGGEQMEYIYRADPEVLVKAAREERCKSIAYTYSEPLVYYEYVYDSSALAHRHGLRNVLVTAGYVNQTPLRKLCKVTDAANCDLKSFEDEFYRSNCGAELQPVLDSLVTMKAEGVWLEITNLVIPTLNDDLKMIRRMCEWIRDELGADTPLHFSRFRPMYRMKNLPNTPAETLMRARAEAMDVGLLFVYVGNLWGDDAESTKCPRDGTMLIRRTGYRIEENNLVDGRCPVCRTPISGVWS